MSQTTSTPDAGGATPTRTPDALDRFFDWVRGLGIRRDSQDKWAAGVASGVAHRLGVDPVLVRAAFFVLALFGGFGVTAYLVGWSLLPSDRDRAAGLRAGEERGEILAERAVRHGEGWPIVLLVLTALSLFGGGLWDHGGAWWGLGWVIPVGIIGWVVYRRSQHQPILPRGATDPSPASPYSPSPTPYASYAGSEPTTTSYAAPSTAPYAAAPPHSAPPARVPRPPRPPRPRRRRPGSALTLLTLGLGVGAYGTGVLLDGPTGFPGSGQLLGSILALTVVALAVLTLGLAGRKSGFLGLVVVVLAIGTALSTVSSDAVRGGIGERTWTPSATTSHVSYGLGLGDGTIDLRNLPTTATTPATVDVSVGLGDLTIRLPKGMDAVVVTEMGAGDVSVDGTVVNRFRPGRDGGTSPYTWTTPGSTTDVRVDAHVGAGSVHIEQGQ